MSKIEISMEQVHKSINMWIQQIFQNNDEKLDAKTFQERCNQMSKLPKLTEHECQDFFGEKKIMTAQELIPHIKIVLMGGLQEQEKEIFNVVEAHIQSACGDAKQVSLAQICAFTGWDVTDLQPLKIINIANPQNQQETIPAITRLDALILLVKFTKSFIRLI